MYFDSVNFMSKSHSVCPTTRSVPVPTETRLTSHPGFSALPPPLVFSVFSLLHKCRYSMSHCESHRSAVVVLFLDVKDSSHAALCSSVWLQLLMKKAEEVGGSQSPLAPSHTYCIPVCCINTPTIFRNNNIT